MEHLMLSEGTDTTPIVRKIAGRTFSNGAEERKWLDAQSAEERQEYGNRLARALFPLLRPWVVHDPDDYREFAPGLWIPQSHGYSFIDRQDGRTPTSTRELHLVEARVNEPLDDSLFQVEFKDGVQVADLLHDPPLFYKYQADRTPEEFQAIVEEHKQQNEAWQKQEAVRDAWVGKPAPELPQSTWLNGPPLDWAALKGKVVLLDFWSTTCGPCRNDLPQVQQLHKQQRDGSGIVAIGIHTAGTDAEEVARFAKEMELTYPIVIDEPTGARASFGKFFNQVGVHGIPHSFVVDPNGNIAAHGRLHETLSKAYQLAREQQQAK